MPGIWEHCQWDVSILSVSSASGIWQHCLWMSTLVTDYHHQLSFGISLTRWSYLSFFNFPYYQLKGLKGFAVITRFRIDDKD